MSKATKNTATPKDQPKFQDDPEVIGYQWINGWSDKDKNPIVDGKGDQVKSGSAIFTGGGWTEGYTLSQLNTDIHEKRVIMFINGKVIVYRHSTRNNSGRRDSTVA